MKAVLVVLFYFLLAGQLMAADRVVSEYVYKQLTRVHELMEENQNEQALKRLQKMRPARMNRYEQALVQQTYGYLYAAREEYGLAIEAIEKSLALSVLPPTARRNTLYNLAQLQLTSADVTQAIVTLEQLFKQNTQAAPQAHALAGTAYAKVKRYAEAIKHLRQAIATESEAPETWYRQLLAVYYDTARYKAAARLLEQMTQQFPQRKAYWLQLSSIYRRLQDDTKSLAVLELAYQQGLLTNERELTDLVHYYLYMDMPYQAGKRLDKALLEGAVSSTSQHWRLLSDTWLHAKETQYAISAMQRATELAQDAESNLRLAQLAFQAEDWSLVIHAVDQAFQIGGLTDPGQGRLLQGMAHYRRGDYQAAKAVFEQALTDTSVQAEARKWLDYMASG
jgi:tetratricopeptide (TPR) repeat protein